MFKVVQYLKGKYLRTVNINLTIADATALCKYVMFDKKLDYRVESM